MSALGALFGVPGASRLLVGIETDDQEPDMTRLYIDARWQNRYILVTRDEGDRIERQWGSGQHMFIDIPDDALVYLSTEVTP